MEYKMKSIRIKNFRSFVDTNEISIKPLTVLLGKNSSGKSSFLRLFPLLKQSFDERTRGALSLFGKDVDFGEFKDIKSSFVDEDHIELSFTINFPKIKKRFFLQTNEEPVEKTDECNVTVKIHEDSQGVLFVSSFTISIVGATISCDTTVNNKISRFEVNGHDFANHLTNIVPSYTIRNSFLPSLYDKNNNQPYGFDLISFYQPAIVEFEKYLGRQVKNRKDKIFQLLVSLPLLSIDKMFVELKSCNFLGKIWKRRIQELFDTDYKEYLYSLIILALSPAIIGELQEYLARLFHNITYAKPLRANAERYYRTQSLATNDVAADGSNLISFLQNLSPGLKKKLDAWTSENFHFIVDLQRFEGHQSIKIKEAESISYNITDMGFGYSQILPLIIQLWLIAQNNLPLNFLRRSRKQCKTFFYAVEQPELHLHPEFQARLLIQMLDIIRTAKDNGIEIKILIETHSETIINYIGKLIAKQRISHNDVNVLIFDKELNRPTKISQASYDNDGVLNNWPFGFFSILD